MEIYTQQKQLRIVDICDSDINYLTLKTLSGPNPVIMVQLASVFILIAAPTIAGVNALNRAKSRLAGKVYCSAIGSFANFLMSAKVESFSKFFSGNMSFFDCLEGSFLRIPMGPESLETPSIRNGMHQGLLLPKCSVRNLIENIEKFSLKYETTPIFPISKYRAPICTSANISGDARGPIVELRTAKNFALQTNIPLIIENHEMDKDSLSFPILSFERNKISIERGGNGISKILNNLPSSISIEMVF